MLNIQGYGDNLTVNNVRIGDLSPKQHEKIEFSKEQNKMREMGNGLFTTPAER